MRPLLPSAVLLVYALLIGTETRARAASARGTRSLAVEEADAPPAAGDGAADAPAGGDLRPAEAAAACNMDFPRFSEEPINPVWQVNDIWILSVSGFSPFPWFYSGI